MTFSGNTTSLAPLIPITHDVPRDLTASLFRNVGAVEIAQLSEANSPGVKVQSCS